MNSLLIALSILLLATASCEADTRLAKNELYRIKTENDSGYVFINKKAWFGGTMQGTYYVDGGKLYADIHNITIKASRRRYYIRTENGDMAIEQASPYHAPAFQEYPETWEYRDSVYSVKVKRDIEYGRAEGYWADFPDSDEPFLGIYMSKMGDKKKKELSLTMDVYTPKDKGIATRPLLVLIHGGGFYNGNKTNAGYQEWGRYFASLGYTVASVNYRLGFHANKASIEKAGYRAMQDVNGAIRYILHNYQDYGVDPDRVFVAGTSAGAITALNLAFMTQDDVPASARGEGLIEDVNPHLKEKFSIRAVGSMWGAVNDLSVIKNRNIPIIAFHSTGDPVVPFGADHPFQDVFGNGLITPVMYGDGQIIPYAQSLGRKAVLHKYDLPGIHAINIGDDFKINHLSYEIQYALRDFFADVMLPHPANFRIFSGSQEIKIDPTDVKLASWAVDGGVIMESDKGFAKVLLFPDAPSHSLTVSGEYKNGLTFNKNVPL